jgi:hypothetical protein
MVVIEAKVTGINSARTKWYFGDGKTGYGKALQKSYRKPGGYPSEL